MNVSQIDQHSISLPTEYLLARWHSTNGCHALVFFLRKGDFCSNVDERVQDLVRARAPPGMSHPRPPPFQLHRSDPLLFKPINIQSNSSPDQFSSTGSSAPCFYFHSATVHNITTTLSMHMRVKLTQLVQQSNKYYTHMVIISMHRSKTFIVLNVLWEVPWGAVKPWEGTFAEKFPDSSDHLDSFFRINLTKWWPLFKSCLSLCFRFLCLISRQFYKHLSILQRFSFQVGLWCDRIDLEHRNGQSAGKVENWKNWKTIISLSN